MSRSTKMVALLASLLLVLHGFDAVADVHLDADPPMAVTFNVPSASPDITTVMQAHQVIDYVYTVWDDDTFTHLEPAPPEPPYGTFPQRDKHQLTNISFTGQWGWWISASVTPGLLGGLVELEDYTLRLVSSNDTGFQKNVSVTLSWNDQALGFIPPPPPPRWTITGNRDDTSLNLQKYIAISP